MDFLKLSVEDGVGLITIQRPPANALSSALITALNSVLDEIDHNPSIRVIVLHGDGRFFSAGADIKEFTEVSSGSEFSKLASLGQQVFERIESYDKPVIAAIHGAALGGGLELAMGCHIRYVAEDAKLGLPELSLGLIPGFGGTQRLPRYVGTAKAAEMLFTSEPISGLEAVEWGLANKAFPVEELLPKTLELAKKIALKSPIALQAAITMLQYSKSDAFHNGIKAEAESFGTVFESADAKEGIQAFIEKRQPTFTGK
ncbi:enoyl-CoA hydratase [Ureibacillus composti]|nr:enoyl-CoA hydratase [Ureibacillus composti]